MSRAMQSRTDTERINRLQARLARLGHRYSNAQLRKLVRVAGSEKPGDIIAQAMGWPPRLSERQIRQIIDSAEDMGPTSWRDIDPLVYGGIRRSRTRRR